MTKAFLLWLFIWCGNGYAVLAQTNKGEQNAPGQKQPTAEKRKYPKRTPPSKSKSEEGSAVSKNMPVQEPSALFPDWSPPSFDWGIGPIVAFKYVSETAPTETKRTTQLETGIIGQISGIPIVGGNSGFYLEPSAGHAWGRVDNFFSGEEAKTTTSSLKYQRSWGSLDNILLLGFYKHTLGIGAGLKKFDPQSIEPIRSFTIKNDFGFLLLPWTSFHYTHNYLKGYHVYSRPFLIEQDHWIHQRLFTSVLNFYIDVGPGFTFTEEYKYLDDKNQKVADGRIDYLQALTSFDLFWKFGFSGSAKYVYRASTKDLGIYATTKLPEDSLYDPPHTPMPEDSLSASAFLGARQIFGPVGFGLHYSLLMLNVSEKDDKERYVSKEYGPVITLDLML